VAGRIRAVRARWGACTHRRGGRARDAGMAGARRARADEVGLIEPSLVSCGESGLLGELVEGVLVVACGGAQGAGCGRVGIGELSQAGLQEPGV
jgi:hypothetical protein